MIISVVNNGMQIGSDRKCAALVGARSDRNDILFKGKEKERKKEEKERKGEKRKGPEGMEGADDGIPFCLRLHLEWEGRSKGGRKTEKTSRRPSS